MNLNNTLLSYIRTYVPYGIGAVLTWLLVHAGLDLTGAFQVALVAFSVAVVTNIYYLLIRLFEERFPAFGVFLGFPKAPEYSQVSNLWASLVRTAIPTLVSAVVVSVLAIFVHFDADTQAGVIAALSASVSGLYYALAKQITTRWPATSVLLGTASQPVFETPDAAAERSPDPGLMPEPSPDVNAAIDAVSDDVDATPVAPDYQAKHVE